MKMHRKGWNALFATACMLALPIQGCTAEEQAAFTSSGGPLFAFVGFAIDFGRQLLAAFLF